MVSLRSAAWIGFDRIPCYRLIRLSGVFRRAGEDGTARYAHARQVLAFSPSIKIELEEEEEE